MSALVKRLEGFFGGIAFACVLVGSSAGKIIRWTTNANLKVSLLLVTVIITTDSVLR